MIPSQEAWRIFKGRQEPPVFVTAYDAAFARLAESVGAAGVIVGDTVGPLALGLASAEDVGIEMMRHHAAAVRRGVADIPVMADVPLGIIGGDETTAVETSRRLADDTGVDAVKIEGVAPHVLRIVERLAHAGIAVSAHIEGDGNRDATLMDHASRLVDAGVVCIVLVSIDADDAAAITRRVSVPTIGKNAGGACDAQVVNAYQALGLTPGAVNLPLRQLLASAMTHGS